MSVKKQGVKITAEVAGAVANIRIVEYIYDYSDSSSYNMRRIVDDLIVKGVTSALVYLNTKGGDAIEASEMCNELGRLGDDNIRIQAGAVVASAGTRFLARFKSAAYPTTQIMIHRPMLSVSGDIKKIEAQTRLLVNMTEDYKNAYAKKTGKSPEQIEALWADGDYWMTAEHALKEGFIDSITEDESTLSITAEDVAILQACGAPIIPSLNNSHTQNSNQMDRTKLISKLKLAADATEAEIDAALDKATEAQTTLEASTQAAENSALVKAKALVAKAQKDKKITAVEAAHYEKLALVDYDSTAAVLEAKVAIPQLSAQLNIASKKGEETTVEAIAGWTMEDYLEKDPEALKALYDSAPEVVARLEKQYFSK